MKSMVSFPKSGVVDCLHGALDLDQIVSSYGMDTSKRGSGMSDLHRNLQRRIANHNEDISKSNPNPYKKTKRSESHSHIGLEFSAPNDGPAVIFLFFN